MLSGVRKYVFFTKIRKIFKVKLRTQTMKANNAVIRDLDSLYLIAYCTHINTKISHTNKLSSTYESQVQSPFEKKYETQNEKQHYTLD